MSTDLGDQLPSDLLAKLSAPMSPSGGTAIPICTIDPNGWPHPALLSANEVSAPNNASLVVATFDGTTTTRNLRANGKLTLVFVDDSMTYYVKGTATAGDTASGIVSSTITVTHVLSDAPGASEEGARITSGITFEW